MQNDERSEDPASEFLIIGEPKTSSAEELCEAGSRLGVSLPNRYAQFMAKIGRGRVCGDELILGPEELSVESWLFIDDSNVIRSEECILFCQDLSDGGYVWKKSDMEGFSASSVFYQPPWLKNTEENHRDLEKNLSDRPGMLIRSAIAAGSGFQDFVNRHLLLSNHPTVFHFPPREPELRAKIPYFLSSATISWEPFLFHGLSPFGGKRFHASRVVKELDKEIGIIELRKDIDGNATELYLVATNYSQDAILYLNLDPSIYECHDSTIKFQASRGSEFVEKATNVFVEMGWVLEPVSECDFGVS